MTYFPRKFEIEYEDFGLTNQKETIYKVSPMEFHHVVLNAVEKLIHH